MAKRVSTVILVVALLAVVTACKRSAILHTYRHISADGWEQSDVLAFNVDTVRTAGVYDLGIGIRATNAYPYKRLWIVIDKQMTNPVSVKADTVACTFVNEKEDRNGRGTNTYQYTFPAGKVTLASGQTGRITIRHIMRREILPGVSDIGIKLSR